MPGKGRLLGRDRGNGMAFSVGEVIGLQCPIILTMGHTTNRFALRTGRI